jgi:spermidine/putrescine-binding protein
MRLPRAIFPGAHVGLTIAGCSRESNVTSQGPDLSSSSDRTLNVYSWNGFMETSVIVDFEKGVRHQSSLRCLR